MEAAVFSKGPKDSSQYLMFDQDALVDVVNVEQETLNLCEQKLKTNKTVHNINI